ncbi:MAG TPA: LssY C-terminal domain-containing protein [Candidatus Acidoferrales bacterium]|nr:LssY C-terminal domain-containing protein [Candidatus Acidoferrales bacterium]
MKRALRIFVIACLAFASASVACTAAFSQNALAVAQTSPQNSSAPPAENSTSSLAALEGKRLSLEQMLPALPRRVKSKSGAAGDMINLLVIGSKEQIADAFKAAGWIQPDKTTQDAIVHAIQETMAHKAYAEMPMSQLYLFGRAQDFGFVDGMPIQVVAERNHFRMWRAPWLDSEGHTVWAGAGTHDVGLEKDQTGTLTHRIDPNVDTERDYIIQTLQDAGKVATTEYITPADPVREAVTATGDTYHSDGRILVVYLK